jgi:hypothetical protein
MLVANRWFLSVRHDGSPTQARTGTPRCFCALWPVLCSVAPSRGSSAIRHLTREAVSDLLFSLSREYARRLMYYDKHGKKRSLNSPNFAAY